MSFSPEMKMEGSWVLAFLLLHVIPIGADTSAVAGGPGFAFMRGRGRPNDLTTPSGSSSPNLNRAYSALQAWKSAISDDPSGILSTWVGFDVCSYRGVFCTDLKPGMSAVSGLSVTGIDLNGANLRGTLVEDLGLLSELRLIHLNSNRFSGTVPETFRQLLFLRELDLSNNNFSGSFPLATLNIPNLIYLDLRFNAFSGPIPEYLFAQRFDAIFLNDNEFSGELPDNLGNSPASVINLANNKFSGDLPASFGIMGPTLKEILLLNNSLTGCIPAAVGFLTQVEVFDVSSNRLTGHLPDTLSCLNEVEVLNVAHNELSGVVSDMICSLRSLVNLSVADNFFSGFNQQCQNLFFKNMGIDLSFNCIPGWNMQRPRPECSSIPGLNCLQVQIPGIPTPVVCGLLAGTPATVTTSSSP